MKLLLNQRQFPIGAESDSFTAAMASALIIALGYREDMPYWCAPNERYCTHCASCGDDWLSRHQESIYHCLLTAPAMAFGFEYPWEDKASHSLPNIRNGWRWEDDYVGFIMRFAGITWKRLSGRADDQCRARLCDNGIRDEYGLHDFRDQRSAD